jgi:hypothetical protein
LVATAVAYIEADVERIDLETVINDLLGGQYDNPIRIVALNTAEDWSQDASEDVSQELRRRCDGTVTLRQRNGLLQLLKTK